MHELVHKDGELGTSRAVASQGLAMTLSTFSTTSLEDVIKAGNELEQTDDRPPPEYWLQLYCFQNLKTSEMIIRRAEAAGYKAVVLTVDTPYLGKRYSEIRNKFSLPPHIRLGNFVTNESVDVIAETHKPSETTLYDKKPRKAKIGVPTPGPLRNENGIKYLYFFIDMIDPGISWEITIPWLKSVTSMKIIVKVFCDQLR